ncbi:MAG TPA: PA14 domain-containing protein [Ktedonobacterales bacterium]
MRSRGSLLPLPRAIILRFGANPPNSPPPPPPNQNVTVTRQSDDNSRPPIVRAAIIALIILLLLACGALALGYSTGRIGGNSTANNPTPTATPAIQTTPSTAPTTTATAPATNGLTGAYYRMPTYPIGAPVPAMPSGTPVFTTVDATIDVPQGVWGETGSQHYPHPELGNLGPNGFAIRWTGHVTPPTTGAYTFVTQSDDGVRVWINDQLVVEDWTTHTHAEDCSDVAAPGATEPGPKPATCPTIQLTGGQAYSIKVEYYENQIDGATIQLFWITPGSTARQIVPTSVLSSQ